MTISVIDVTLIDGDGDKLTVRADQSSTDQSIAYHQVIEVNGTAVTSGNPLPVSLSTYTGGDIGTDRSANAPTGPGTNPSFTYNGGTVYQLISVAANPSRKYFEVNNTTGQLVVVVLDNGSNGSGTVSMFPLSPGTAQYQMGAGWSTMTEQGRIRVFGASGAYLYAREN
jgi:hypothetical protein